MGFVCTGFEGGSELCNVVCAVVEVLHNTYVLNLLLEWC